MGAKKSYSEAVIAYAAARGINAGELPLLIDGCSGGLTWLYALGGKTISCEDCCNIHDLDYQLGGTPDDRARADAALRTCAAAAGSFPPGIRGTCRRLWRTARAWIMWASVRLFGGRYWTRT